jgi:hypothetical protein
MANQSFFNKNQLHIKSDQIKEVTLSQQHTFYLGELAIGLVLFVNREDHLDY